MTRQKKEFLAQIRFIEEDMIVCDQLSYGNMPDKYYEEAYGDIQRLEDKLVQLRHFPNAEAMHNDPRVPKVGEDDDDELPLW